MTPQDFADLMEGKTKAEPLHNGVQQYPADLLRRWSSCSSRLNLMAREVLLELDTMTQLEREKSEHIDRS